MTRILVTAVFWFGCLLSARALSAEIPVTVTNLDQYKYLFAVSARVVSNGVSFHITITGKLEDIHADSGVALSIVIHTKDAHGSESSIAPLKPAIPLALKTDKRVWDVYFTASYELLKTPGLCFVFTENDPNGPAADFYELELKGFLK